MSPTLSQRGAAMLVLLVTSLGGILFIGRPLIEKYSHARRPRARARAACTNLYAGTAWVRNLRCPAAWRLNGSRVL